MRRIITILTLISAIALTGCVSEAEQIRKKAEIVKACTDSGGEWYNTPGWGENCNFDTRKDGAK